MKTRQDLFNEASRKLRESGNQSAELDARLLVCHSCNISYESLVSESNEIASPEEIRVLSEVVSRRLEGEPVSRINGFRSFWKHDFLLNSDTLDPRPDTETLVEAALSIVDHEGWNNKKINILDLGTGCGCILLSLLYELPNSHGLGVDVSSKALEIAELNAEILSVNSRAEFVVSDWLEKVKGSFNLIVSNPPYIPTAEIAGLALEVARFDPRIAVDGGDDGLDAYRHLIPKLSTVICPGGWVLFEHGIGQEKDLSKVLEMNKFLCDDSGICRQRDLSGRIRVVVGKALS